MIAPRTCALLALLTAPTGCAAGRSLVTTPEDFADYRLVRTRPSLEDRLRAAEAYLADHPDGAFVPEVRRFFARAEAAYYASKRGSTVGLVAYLDVLPTGPHAAMARRELDGRRRTAVDLLGTRAASTEARLREAAEARARARRELEAWVRRFATPSLFAGRIEQGPAELVVAWSLSLPAPRCQPLEGDEVGRRCDKVVTRPYELPADAAAPSRELLLAITTREEGSGQLCSVELAGPALFTRWEEAGQLLPAQRGAAREQAVLSATAMVRSIFETQAEAGCREDPPGAARFTCGATSVEVAGAADAAADDVVRISRASPCPSP